MINRLSEETFEHYLELMASGSPVDLSGVSFVDPYGIVGVLEAGRLYQSRGIRRELIIPRSEDVLRYMERMDFFRYAGRYYIIRPGRPNLSSRYLRRASSDVLLEITPIEESDDIHFIVDRVRDRARSILQKHLNYDEKTVSGFIVALSEICQNIIEHSDNIGFVGIQKYRFSKLEKNVVKIAVMDLGRGFRASLSERIHVSSDCEAIEKAMYHAVSRHSDRGRGLGLAAVRKFVSDCNGRLSIRSGSARLSMLPDWSWGRERETGLREFPGAQIGIMLPDI
jgi:anti-sigma regulatory factor (Ser/Thr protein kinase)